MKDLRKFVISYPPFSNAEVNIDLLTEKWKDHYCIEFHSPSMTELGDHDCWQLVSIKQDSAGVSYERINISELTAKQIVSRNNLIEMSMFPHDETNKNLEFKNKESIDRDLISHEMNLLECENMLRIAKSYVDSRKDALNK